MWCGNYRRDLREVFIAKFVEGDRTIGEMVRWSGHYKRKEKDCGGQIMWLRICPKLFEDYGVWTNVLILSWSGGRLVPKFLMLNDWSSSFIKTKCTKWSGELLKKLVCWESLTMESGFHNWLFVADYWSLVGFSTNFSALQFYV